MPIFMMTSLVTTPGCLCLSAFDPESLSLLLLVELASSDRRNPGMYGHGSSCLWKIKSLRFSFKVFLKDRIKVITAIRILLLPFDVT